MNVPVGYTYTNAIPQTKSVQQTAQTNSPAQYQTAPQVPAQQPPMTIPNSSNGVNIIIYNPSVNPNGANFNNTYNAPSGLPGQAYPAPYYTNPVPATSTTQVQTPASTPIANTPVSDDKKSDKKMKDVVELTDDYIRTLENYLRNPNPDIKLMGAKELMKRFKEDDTRKNDPALTSLLNLTLQSKYSPVKMVGMGIISNGWAKGDELTQQLLAQIQQTSTGYGLDALDAAEAALKSAGNTIKIEDNSPDKPEKSKKKTDEA